MPRDRATCESPRPGYKLLQHTSASTTRLLAFSHRGRHRDLAAGAPRRRRLSRTRVAEECVPRLRASGRRRASATTSSSRHCSARESASNESPQACHYHYQYQKRDPYRREIRRRCWRPRLATAAPRRGLHRKQRVLAAWWPFHARRLRLLGSSSWWRSSACEPSECCVRRGCRSN